MLCSDDAMSVKAGSGERGREIECVLDASGMHYRAPSTISFYNSSGFLQWESALVDGMTTWSTMYMSMRVHCTYCPHVL